MVIDSRSKEAFGRAHIPNSYSIPLDKFFSTWAGYVLPHGKPVVLVVESPEQWDNVVRQLVRVGYDDILGYLDGGISPWELAGYPLAALPQLSAEELKRRLERREEILVLDVRTDSEWTAERYPYATHLHAGHVPDRWMELENHWEVTKETPIAVVCRTGHRATIAASILQHKGFINVFNVPGGMTAWREVGGLTCSEPGCPDYKPWQPWWQDTMGPTIKVTESIAVGSQPTERDLEAVAAKGYKTVINLRDPQEKTPLPFDQEKAKVEELDMEYVNYIVAPDNINDETVEQFFNVLKESTVRGPVFVHCNTAHRAGALTLMHLALEKGWAPQEAFENAHSMGFECDSHPQLKAYFADYLTRKVKGS